MIEFLHGTPSDEEIAAIVAALTMRHPEPVEGWQNGSAALRQAQRDTSNAWALAARYPDLEIEDLRAALRQTQGDTGRVF